MADSSQRGDSGNASLSNASGHSLQELAPKSKFIGVPDIRFNAICADWKQCQPGDLYIAMETVGSDGHDYIDEAIRNGASAIVAERYLIADVPVCVVDDSREIYGRICQKLSGQPTTELCVIGVTGTNGKTSTAHLIQSILKASGQMAGLVSSLETNDGFSAKPAESELPGVARLAKEMSEMSMNGCTHAVVEFSSKSLAERQLAGIELDAAVVTNVRRDHLDLHGNMKNYRAAKMRLIDHVSVDGFAILNADDRVSQDMLPEINCPTITYGLNNDCEISATIIESFSGEQTFLLHAGNHSMPVRTKMAGEHHVRNCLAAAAVGLVLGIDLTAIVKGIEAITRLPGRLEQVECGQPFGVFVDSARTPDQLASALRTLRNNYEGKIYCVFGNSDEEAAYHSPWLGKVLERSCDLPIITGANERSGGALHRAHQILDGFDRPAVAHLIPNRTAAIEFALQEAEPGDCVLIAGQGEKPVLQNGDTVTAVLDSDACRTWLYEVGASKEYVEAEVSSAVTYRIQDFQS